MLMTPRPGVLATPELVDMVDFVPEAYYPMLPFNRWLLPNLNPATVSSWKEYLDQKRSEMVISCNSSYRCLQVFLQIANGLLYAYGALIYDLGMIAYTYNKKHSENWIVQTLLNRCGEQPVAAALGLPHAGQQAWLTYDESGCAAAVFMLQLRPISMEEAGDFQMDEQQKLMLELLLQVAKGKSSSWLPYLRTLPRSFPTLPLWFTEEEKRFLKGTSVDTLLEASHIANDQDLLAMQRWCQQHPETFATCPSLEQLRWAASVVASRAFDSTQAQVLLAPFADALNHSGAPHTRMRDCGDHLLFHTERPVELGEEVMNCYGLQGNTQWLMNGGFLDRSRPCDDLLVTPADVVSAVLDYLMNRKVDSDEEDELGRDPCCKSWHGMAFSPPSMEMKRPYARDSL
ncbi:Ribosomal lysine N-methyltransferase set10 (SET domain-containing protein 10) [Durusdinium trenchii]|uniref:Ribosomal lysine N-methyltransferase set10 (SET domain-containing protein 10) n=1 Tax=Durusdinium trenchii TaxID=1381693 RepID=A0ABP0Q3V0_9DINO